MTNSSSPQPTRRERLRPAELIGLSLGLGLFIGLVVLLTTQEPIFAAVAFGIGFIVSLVAIALFMLTLKPDAFENTEITTQDEEK